MNIQSQFKSRFLHWIFLVPTVLVLVVFLYFPAWQSLILSLFRSNLFLGTRQFIGFENFKNLFTGPLAPAYGQVFVQTIVFSVLVIFPGLVISLILATLTNSLGKEGKIYRILLIWPYALSPAVAGTIFSFMFNPETGAVNTFLGLFTSWQPRWLDSPLLVFFLVVSGSIWKNLGYNIVFYLAFLQNIPAENYEAAALDGAGTFRQFLKITIPLVSPVSYFLVFTNMSYALFEAFALVDILTSGGPVGSPPVDHAGLTTFLIYKVFQDGFGGSSNMGFAAAQSVILMVLVALLTMFQFKFGETKVHYGGSSS
ncbi:sugar ABC transporter permease [Oceanispirochaeta crateris]|uniref:sn-glycerol-3-phosphate transport system permease protein UgpA n=1 Tax=Oceanispirochaeta crateris TaxID=2518645 RepID=A0A5C1QMG4_9SPIO|nr:sugar ABC transporter permease [Oceanispirochaeta crateris]QEN08518.1 sugar ABC transporter permease [Oceanispirochaeta crateris]